MPDTLPPFTVSAEYAASHPSAPAAPKPGVFTSELWLHLAALVAPLIYNAAVNSSDPTVVAAAQAAASVYTLARTWLKTRSLPR